MLKGDDDKAISVNIHGNMGDFNYAGKIHTVLWIISLALCLT